MAWLLALPLLLTALAVAVLVVRAAAAAKGADAPQRLLALATAGLPSPRNAWGRALRAELAAITDPAQRSRFARSAAWAGIRAGFAPRSWVLAGSAGVVAAVGTLAVSRVMLTSDRIGLMPFTVLAPMLLLFAVAVAAGLLFGAFRAAVQTGALAFCAVLVGVFAVMLPEAALWFELHGVYIIDGDPPMPGTEVSTASAVVDVFTTGLFQVHLLHWLPAPVLGAALGAALHHRRARVVSTAS